MTKFDMILCAALIPAAPAASQDALAGAALYAQHCAVCHGTQALGDGPMSPALLVQPADLTTLTQRYSGTFPTLRVVSRIDGRDPLVSHGSDMPIYGDFFEGQTVPLKTQAGQPILTSQPIVDLVAYLEGLQE
jgi:mono/diheme cytochrome c family protein